MLMKFLLLFFTVLISYTSTAQKIMGAAMADDKGITDKQEKKDAGYHLSYTS